MARGPSGVGRGSLAAADTLSGSQTPEVRVEMGQKEHLLQGLENLIRGMERDERILGMFM